MSSFEIGTEVSKLETNLTNRFQSINEEDHFLGKSGGGKLFTIVDWSPRIDLIEDQNEFLVKVDLPEMELKNIRIQIYSDVLTIFGNRKDDHSNINKVYYRAERQSGTFTRSISIPCSVSIHKTKTELKDGVLYVHLIKSVKCLTKGNS